MIRSIKLGIAISAFVASLFMLILSDSAPDGFEFLWLLPLFYGTLVLRANIADTISKYISYSVVFFVLSFRYVILPVSMAATGIYFHSKGFSTEKYINYLTTLLMIYEMIVIIISMHYYSQKIPKQVNVVNVVGNYKSSYYLYIVFIVIGLVGIVLVDSIRKRTNFIVSSDDFEIIEMNAIMLTLFIISSMTFKLAFISLLLFGSRVKKSLRLKKVINILTLGCGFLAMSFYWTTNRSTVIIQSIATIVMLKKYNFIGKNATIALALLPIASIITMSASRWFGYSSGSDVGNDFYDYLNVEQMMDYLQTYLAGPHIVSLALTTNYDRSLFEICSATINEILSSIYYVRQIFPPEQEQMVVIFNRQLGFLWIYNFILPALGQGYLIFGPLLAPLLSFIYMSIAYKVEVKASSVRNPGYKYAYFILLGWLGLSPLQSIGIVTFSISSIFLPFYLMVFMNNWCNKHIR